MNMLKDGMIAVVARAVGNGITHWNVQYKSSIFWKPI